MKEISPFLRRLMYRKIDPKSIFLCSISGCRSPNLSYINRQQIAFVSTDSRKKKVASKKRSNKLTPPHVTNWRTGNIEVGNVTIENEDEYQSLSPWLRQLWKGNNDDQSSTDSSTPSMIGQTIIATSEPFALSSNTIEPQENPPKDSIIEDGIGDIFDDEDDVQKLQRKRSGGSGNDFDGNGYHGGNDKDQGDDNDDDDDGDGENLKDEIEPPVDRVQSPDRVLTNPKESWPIDPYVYPHLRASLTGIYSEESELANRDTGLSICTLGTSAGGSCRLRSNTSTVVRSGTYCYLIDAGEGIQRQFMLSKLRYSDIRKIFITHMHADHVLGLPGLLLNLQTARLNSMTQRPVEIYGPVGLYNYIAMALALTCAELRKLKVYVYELHGGTQRSMRFSGNRKTYPEFQHKCLIRKAIPQNNDGTWTLVEPLEIITPELANQMRSQPKGFSVKAAEIHHIPELQCFGYTMHEPLSQPRNLNVDAARNLGIASTESFRLLKSGFSVMNDDKSRLVHADEVCTKPNRPRKITVLGDCCLVPPAMEALAMNSDVLIHEATLSIYDTGKKVVSGGHSTSAQAAIFANKVKAQLLILNHLPKTLNTFVKCKEWLSEAESRIRGPTKVQLGFDHLEVCIPRNGFDFSDVETSQSIWPADRISETTKSNENVPKLRIPGWR